MVPASACLEDQGFKPHKRSIMRSLRIEEILENQHIRLRLLISHLSVRSVRFPKRDTGRKLMNRYIGTLRVMEDLMAHYDACMQHLTSLARIIFI